MYDNELCVFYADNQYTNINKILHNQSRENPRTLILYSDASNIEY